MDPRAASTRLPFTVMPQACPAEPATAHWPACLAAIQAARAAYGVRRRSDKSRIRAVLSVWAALVLGSAAQTSLAEPKAQRPTELVVATVNNQHTLQLQRLSSHFVAAHPAVRLRWVTLDEDQLRQAVSRDVIKGEGRFDVVTLGNYEAQSWAGQPWLSRLQPSVSYDEDEILPSVRRSLKQEGSWIALPFYAESTMTMVRRDLLGAAGLPWNDRPSWEEIGLWASRLHRPDQGIYGVCLRGKPGWGQNMALLTTMAHTHGARWFDLRWQPQLTSEAWQTALTRYQELLTLYGPPDAVANGYNENLSLFAAGRCALWVDATVAGYTLENPELSRVAGRVSYAAAPVGQHIEGSQWLWIWALAVPASSRHPQLARRFVEWATSTDYQRLAARELGWSAVPAGVRRGLYEQPGFIARFPHALVEKSALETADPRKPSVLPVPYVGIQWVGIPEFQALGTAVGHLLSQTLPPQRLPVADQLARAQTLVRSQMQQSGYLKPP